MLRQFQADSKGKDQTDPLKAARDGALPVRPHFHTGWSI
jgi:hypothetical protein